MKRELLPIAVCSWCAVILGAAVIASAHDIVSFTGSVIATLIALTIAIASTIEYRQP